MSDKKHSNYYISMKPKLLKDFEEMGKLTREAGKAYFDDATLDSMINETREAFESLIPQIPYIGGRKNRLSEMLPKSAMSLALYKVLKARGMPVEEIGKLNYEIAERYSKHVPRLVRPFMSRLRFSRIIKRVLKKMAERSQKREYIEDWVFFYVEGDGEHFDLGIDYTECAICKLFQQQGADEFTKYMCLIDFASSKASGSGLFRTTTLAEGAEKCDFRWKKGGDVKSGWPPSWLQE